MQKRSAGDFSAIKGMMYVQYISPRCGLACASDLALKGYEVTIFEALHETGGVLTYGIPEFRLPKQLVQSEVKSLESLGVKINTNYVIGKTISLHELDKSFDAIFIANGAGLPMFLDIPGEDLVNVYSANEYLVRNNLMRAYKQDQVTPIKRGGVVAVIGGGNVALDAARVAKRLGGDVSIIYRRTISEMPARKPEIVHTQAEGIKIMELIAPKEFIGTKQVTGIRCMRMELGPLDKTGRRSPIEIADSEFILPCDEVIVAIGQRPNPLLNKELSELGIKTGKGILADDCKTSHPKFFAGGDIIGGSATVIKAMGDGKKAAKAIQDFLTSS